MSLINVVALIISPVAAGTANLVLGGHDFILAAGTSFIPGHGAPTGEALRTGSPGQKSIASFPKSVLAAGVTVTELSFEFRYITGYEKIPSGNGANLSLAITDDALSRSGTVVYSSPHFTEYSYSLNSSNYSAPVNVHVTGLSIPSSNKHTTRLQFSFDNNDRNLQLLIPIAINVTCKGADACFVPAPAPPSPTPPLPPAPLPPATHTPWKNIGPWNIGDDVNGNGEAGTIAVAVSPISNPDLIYMGGNNNAASSGVLKTRNRGRHWSKMNVGLLDTRIHGLFIVDDAGELAPTFTLSSSRPVTASPSLWSSPALIYGLVPERHR